MLPSAGVRLGPERPSEGLGDESAAPPAAVTLKSVALTLAPSAFCIAVWMRLVRVELEGDRFAPVRLYEACTRGHYSALLRWSHEMVPGFWCTQSLLQMSQFVLGRGSGSPSRYSREDATADPAVISLFYVHFTRGKAGC